MDTCVNAFTRCPPALLHAEELTIIYGHMQKKKGRREKADQQRKGGGAWSQGRDVVRIFLGFGPLGRPAGQMVFSGDPCLSRRVERGVVVVVVLVVVVVIDLVVVVVIVGLLLS